MTNNHPTPQPHPDREEIGELERLLSNASSLPWFAGPLQPEDESGAPGGVSVGPFDLAERYGGRPDYSETWANDHYEDAIAFVSGCNHDAAANAALIVAAINALPRLLADAKTVACAKGLLRGPGITIEADSILAKIGPPSVPEGKAETVAAVMRSDWYEARAIDLTKNPDAADMVRVGDMLLSAAISWSERVEKAEALLSAPEPPVGGGWRPISSAPRDKTFVALLRVEKGGVTRYGVGWYMPLDGWRGWRKEGDYEPPTHWFPLPEGPSSAEGK